MIIRKNDKRCIAFSAAIAKAGFLPTETLDPLWKGKSDLMTT